MKIYTYPNIGPFNTNGRGGLKKRQKELKRINRKYNTNDFQLVEIPADFIKKASEEKKTGLKVCSFLDKDSVKHLYSSGFLDKNVEYVLHTEPVFSRHGIDGSCTPKLEWYNLDWLQKFIEHIFSIIDFFGVTPHAIEIHPGKYERGKNNIKVLSKAIDIIHTEYNLKYDEKTLIFIENRTDQYIQDGSDIEDFWKYFSNQYPHLTDKTGIILDIQQFYTSTKKFKLDFKSEFSKISKDSLLGVHIHGRKGRAHQVPVKDDIIPWEFVRDEILNLGDNQRPFHVLPEVHHLKHTEMTYEFCKNFLEL